MYLKVVDGSGLATSRKKYNDKCIVKNKTDEKGNEYKEYGTYVLEAKLILGDMVFSIGSEFVENETENVTKQDCEINAFKRLAKKIKKEYPRLNIVIGADALNAKKTIMDICQENGWKYIIRLKEGAIPTLYQEFEKIAKDENESTKENYEYVTKIEYQENKVNVVRYKDDQKNTEFVYVTDLQISNKNVEATVNLGRRRWKIENEGFNVQKNGTFDIGHLCSRNATAIKVHYLMVQIAHIIRQLLENGVKEIKELKLKLKEISYILKKQLNTIYYHLEVTNIK